MVKKYKILGGLVLVVLLGVVVQRFFARHPMAILSPAGPVAHSERNLIYATMLLSLLVVIPVFVLLFVISYKYREGRHQKYTPEVDGNRMIETIWWTIPTLLIIVVSIMNWTSSYALDPSRALKSHTPPLTIQVVALDWKWLFIYPEQHIATMNYVEIPTNTPVDFQITADAPMNSFWIPRLGGQIYAMPGMSTQLHLLADKAGNYGGSSANISGDGFASMRFVATAAPSTNFKNWVNGVKQTQSVLDQAQYNQLVKPSVPKVTQEYTLGDPSLYDKIVLKYMPLGNVR